MYPPIHILPTLLSLIFHPLSLTSSIAVTEVRKAPDVAQSDGEGEAGEDELDLVTPDPPILFLSPRDADALVVISSVDGDSYLRSVSLQPHILQKGEKMSWVSEILSSTLDV